MAKKPEFKVGDKVWVYYRGPVSEGTVKRENNGSFEVAFDGGFYDWFSQDQLFTSRKSAVKDCALRWLGEVKDEMKEITGLINEMGVRMECKMVIRFPRKKK